MSKYEPTPPLKLGYWVRIIGKYELLPPSHEVIKRLDAAGMGPDRRLKMVDKPCTLYVPWFLNGVNIKECIDYDSKDCICLEPLSDHHGSRCPWWGMPGYDVEPRTLKEEGHER